MKTITNDNYLHHLHNNSHGVKKNSALEKLHDFQIFNQLPPGIMHDLLEGVILITLHNILKQLINTHLININDINDNLKQIDFPNNSNIPHFFHKVFSIKKTNKLKVQLLKFLKYFTVFLD